MLHIGIYGSWIMVWRPWESYEATEEVYRWCAALCCTIKVLGELWKIDGAWTKMLMLDIPIDSNSPEITDRFFYSGTLWESHWVTFPAIHFSSVSTHVDPGRCLLVAAKHWLHADHFTALVYFWLQTIHSVKILSHDLQNSQSKSVSWTDFLALKMCSQFVFQNSPF